MVPIELLDLGFPQPSVCKELNFKQDTIKWDTPVFYCFGWNILYISVKFLWSDVSRKAIFCLDDLPLT